MWPRCSATLSACGGDCAGHGPLDRHPELQHLRAPAGLYQGPARRGLDVSVRRTGPGRGAGGRQRLYGWLGRHGRRRVPVGRVDSLAAQRWLRVRQQPGAHPLARREVLARVGLLDERFFMYGEDLDWCLRARDAGWTVRYEPTVVVQHQHGAASRKRALRTTFHFFRAMDLFYRKHYLDRYHPLVTGAVRTAIYGALAVSMFRSLLTIPSQRRAGL